MRWGFTEGITTVPRMAKSEWSRASSSNPRPIHVTHVLLQEGHLWDRRDVAIPIRAVTAFDGGIQVNMPKGTIQNLPSFTSHSPL